jgi:catechol 2,3-dioxygenase-like lactoylglutathione lyase family enzyme
MCRRNHGAAFVTWFGIARERLAIEAGEDRLVHHASSDHGKRSFCGKCGSSLFCEISHHPDQVDVVLANLDGPIDRAPGMHIYFDSRAAWTDVRDELPRLGGTSGVEPLPGETAEARPAVAIAHIALGVPDIEKAGAFFATLGMRELEQRPDFGLYELRGGTHLLLLPGEAAAKGTPAPFDLMVDDLEREHARLSQAGLAPSAIEERPHHRAFTLVTPSAHVLRVQTSHASGLPV